MLTVKDPLTFDWKNISLVDCLEGNAYDAYFTLKLYNVFYEILDEQNKIGLQEGLVSPALEEFYHIEYDGLDIDLNELEKAKLELEEVLDELKEELFSSEKVKDSYNLNSDKDMVSILYTDEEGFALYPPDKTKGGQPSTSKDTIKLLIDQIEAELEKRSK